jgi:uncharacterized membrane protein YgcG
MRRRSISTRNKLVAAALMLAGAAGPAACSDEQALPAGNDAIRAPASQGGRVLDLAGVLVPAERDALADRLGREQRADGRSVVVVIVRPADGTSLEQLGWAVAGRGAVVPYLLLIDPTRGQVRIEGDLAPEGKAVVVRAMQPGMQAKRYAVAVNAGLTALERLAP